ncbi:MAG: Alkane 1-monooxygenase [Bacteroidota bacterium]
MSMKRNYKYSLSLLPGAMVIAGNLLGGWWVALNVVFVFAVIAVLEVFASEDKDNTNHREDWFPDALLMLHVLVQTTSIVTMLWSLNRFDYSPGQLLLMGISVGTNSGSSAIVIAHELIHRNSRFLRSLGGYLLLTAGNIYFFVDHLKVHHKHVGTDLDPATARRGESVYAFFVRSVSGQIKSAWSVESVQLKKSGKSGFHPSNYVLSSFVILLILVASLWFFLGPLFAAMFMLQTFFANFLLEYTNYIEHYGLSRKPNERVTEKHSWQTDKVISRYFLIDLSRHADHHYHASKPYHTLHSYESSPVLPLGYVSMIFCALIPPLFYQIMEPRIPNVHIPSENH